MAKRRRARRKISKKKIQPTQRRTIIAVVLAVLIVPTLVATIFLSTARYTVLDANFHKKNLRQINFYEQLIEQAIPAEIREVDSGNQTLTATVIREAVVYLFQRLVTPQWAEEKIENVIDQTFVYILQSDNDTEDKMVNFLDNFRNNFLVAVNKNLAIAADNIPSCQGSIIQVIMPNIDCDSTDETLTVVRQEIKVVQQEVTGLSERLANISSNLERDVKALVLLKSFTRDIYSWQWISLTILLILAGLLAFTMRREITRMLDWLATPLIFGAAIVLIINSALHSWVGQYVAAFTAPNLAVETQSLLSELLQTTTNNTFAFTHNIALVVLIVAAIVIVVAWLKDRYSFRWPWQDRK